MNTMRELKVWHEYLICMDGFTTTKSVIIRHENKIEFALVQNV